MRVIKWKGKGMITVGIVFASLVVIVIVTLAVMGHQSRSGTAPRLDGGRLAPCTKRPNCVSSENPEDKRHFITPLNAPDESPEATRGALRQIIETMGGHITVDEEIYLAATFKSRIFGFMDDLEIRFDKEAALIHVRSGSRTGHSDKGINRKRVEQLREMFTKYAAITG